MKWLSAVLVILMSLGQLSKGERILGIAPVPSKSHWAVFSSVLKVLLEAGHEVTVIAPYELTNATSIVFTDGDQLLRSSLALLDVKNWKVQIPYLGPITTPILANTFLHQLMENKEVQEFIADKSQHFDLVLLEPLSTDILYGFGEHFKAPIITVSPLVPFKWINDAMGNPADPSYIPNPYLPFTSKMSLKERTQNYLISILAYMECEFISKPHHNQMYKKYFPNSERDLQTIIQEDVAFGFVNTHFSLSFPRPYVPNLIEIGGIHIDRKVSELPKEYQDYLDNAKEGVVLFSMGSMLQASDFTEEQRRTIISALGKLKQKVIWRYNLPDTDQLPKNIFTSNWLPQKEILAHPNVKAFITHGGMLGTTESVYHGKPMIGIPVLGDQHLNIARAVKRGYALKLERETLTEEGILEAVNEILSNPSYSEQAKTLSSIFRDQPMTPQENVLYWTEYVLRHKGAKHLQVESKKLNVVQFYGLDVLVVLLLGVFVTVILPNYLVAKWILKKICKCQKKEKNVKLKRK